MQILEFSLGPVQDFVAKARRTQDFWSGSFLLSYLIGQAIHAVENADGRIIFPVTEKDKIMESIRGKEKFEWPYIASLPNRFRAEVPIGFDPEDCKQAITKEWNKIAELVYGKYIVPVQNLGKGTKEIWDRQIGGFWEMYWAIGDNCLSKRKNWRSFLPTVEPGDKCTLMGNLQEISGYVRSRELEKPQKFWEKIRGLHKDAIKEDERLCAIALIKRFFPFLTSEFLGFERNLHYPSTPYLAAVPWIAKVMENAPEICSDFARAAHSDMHRSEEIPSLFMDIKNNMSPATKGFADLDGNCFFGSCLENDNLWPDYNESKEKMAKLLKDSFTSEASPFYALLIMDGDEMGKLLSNYKGKEMEVSRALGEFTRFVPECLNKHNGICVYTGGDDVMALLPVDNALDAASELREKYISCFEPIPATISGAIVYAHFNTPLQLVIRDSHILLDGIAKDSTGRDSLAVRVWKGSGPVLDWSCPWEVLLDDGKPLLIYKVIKGFGGEEPKFSTSYFHNINRLISYLDKEARRDRELLEKLLYAEFVKSQESKKVDKDVFHKQAEDKVNALLDICLQSKREMGIVKKNIGPFKFDGAKLIKFLVTKGVEG
jgi:CRISPR-associated protein Cmr2